MLHTVFDDTTDFFREVDDAMEEQVTEDHETVDRGGPPEVYDSTDARSEGGCGWCWLSEGYCGHQPASAEVPGRRVQQLHDREEEQRYEPTILVLRGFSCLPWYQGYPRESAGGGDAVTAEGAAAAARTRMVALR